MPHIQLPSKIIDSRGSSSFLLELDTMKAFPYVFSLVVLSAVGSSAAKAEEGDIFTGPQAIEEQAGGAPSAARPKGALEPSGQPLGETAPLNGDRTTGPTAQNQSARPESVRITKEIRQQILERKDLSTAAKNVKIITDDRGAVTLRGPVKSANERQEIEQIARNNAQGGQVANQLVVKGEEASRGGAHG
jgi:hyperosmotically inducible protein